MHPGVLKALEFDRIVEAVARLAQTPPGSRSALRGLTPATTREAVAAALAGNRGNRAFLAGPATSRCARPPSWATSSTRSRSKDARSSRCTCWASPPTSNRSGDRRRRHSAHARNVSAPRRARSSGAASFDHRDGCHPPQDRSGRETSWTTPAPNCDRFAIACANSAAASAARSSRTSAARTRRSTCSSRSSPTATAATCWSCAPSIARRFPASSMAARRAAPACSSSRSSTVEINNDIVALEQQEAEEVRRILLALTDAFRGRGGGSRRARIEVATDARRAAGRRRGYALCDRTRIAPALSRDGRLRAARARGIRSSRRGVSGGVVPCRHPADAAGARARHHRPEYRWQDRGAQDRRAAAAHGAGGLLVPAADGSQLPVFRSCSRTSATSSRSPTNLSTFSGHIANIASMDRALGRSPALVLLDEVGAGTDPNEGGALAMAIIDHFRRRGAMVMATTHYDALKTYASTTDGVTSAGFGFDPETFAPTYRLELRLARAAPGARDRRAPRAAAGDHRDRRRSRARPARDAARGAPREDRARAAGAGSPAAPRRARARRRSRRRRRRLQAREQELRNREETFRRRLDQRDRRTAARRRREIDAVVDQLKARTSTIAAGAERRAARLVPTGDTGAARAEARRALDDVGRSCSERCRRAARLRSPPTAPTAPAAVGDRVAVGALGLEGRRAGASSDGQRGSGRARQAHAREGLRTCACSCRRDRASRRNAGPRERRDGAARAVRSPKST